MSEFDGSNAKMISTPPMEQDENLELSFEQKVPTWSPDGKWIVHWEGVEMIHMSPFTGVKTRSGTGRSQPRSMSGWLAAMAKSGEKSDVATIPPGRPMDS